MNATARPSVWLGLIVLAGTALARAQGEAPPRKAVVVSSAVEDKPEIVSIVPDGTQVKKGDVICELDSARARERLVDQEIVVRRAKLACNEARKARQLAEIALEEYLNGTYPIAMKDCEHEITLAKVELSEAIDRRNELKGQPAAGQAALAAQANLLRAQIAEEKAKQKQHVLQKYTKPRQEAQLRGAVERAASEEQICAAVAERAGQKAANLRGQVEAYVIRAPADGKVVYADPKLEEGAVVRRRQKLVRIEPAAAEAPR